MGPCMKTPHIIRDEDMRARVCRLIAGLDISKPWQVTIVPYRKVRSLSQNNLMWAWLDEVADHVREHTGEDKDDIHEFFKAKFCPAFVAGIAGEFMKYRTTTKLDTAQMSRYMEDIRSWCFSTLGISLSAPPSESNNFTTTKPAA